MKRTFFLAILIFSFLTAIVSAQTDEQQILVPGNPPLKQETIDKSADFFQWVLGGNFTAPELEEYRQQLIRIWREKDTGAINVTGEIAAMRDKLVNVEPEKLKTLVPDLQNGLLKLLRAQPNDGLSVVLLKTYDRIHNLNVKQGGNLPPQQSQSNNNTVDKRALIGEWEENYAGNSDHSTGTGGSVRSSDRAKNIIRFYQDGSYKSAFITQSSFNDSCKFTTSYFGEGVFSFDANTLYLNEKTRRETSRSCLPLDNYDKELQPGNYKYPWQLGRDEKGANLVLVVNGKPHVFYKVEGVGLFGND
jgi:hypothetical protein